MHDYKLIFKKRPYCNTIVFSKGDGVNDFLNNPYRLTLCDFIQNSLNKKLERELLVYVNNQIQIPTNIFADTEFMNTVYRLIFAYLSNVKFVIKSEMPYSNTQGKYYYDTTTLEEKIFRIADYDFFEKNILQYGEYNNVLFDKSDIKHAYDKIADTMTIGSFIYVICYCLKINMNSFKVRVYDLLSKGENVVNTVYEGNDYEHLESFVRYPLNKNFEFYNYMKPQL